MAKQGGGLGKWAAMTLYHGNKKIVFAKGGGAVGFIKMYSSKICEYKDIYI